MPAKRSKQLKPVEEQTIDEFVEVDIKKTSKRTKEYKEAENIFLDAVKKQFRSNKHSGIYYYMLETIKEGILTKDEETGLFNALKAKTKKKKQPSAYNLFIKQKIAEEKLTFKEAVQAWNDQKKEKA